MQQAGRTWGGRGAVLQIKKHFRHWCLCAASSGGIGVLSLRCTWRATCLLRGSGPAALRMFPWGRCHVSLLPLVLCSLESSEHAKCCTWPSGLRVGTGRDKACLRLSPCFLRGRNCPALGTLRGCSYKNNLPNGERKSSNEHGVPTIFPCLGQSSQHRSLAALLRHGRMLLSATTPRIREETEGFSGRISAVDPVPG